eukprot:Amastigsp_a177064_33.p4 type:complete len:234 gc:universal Amastigsp_a177064_33:231-932(+)
MEQEDGDHGLVAAVRHRARLEPSCLEGRQQRQKLWAEAVRIRVRQPRRQRATHGNVAEATRVSECNGHEPHDQPVRFVVISDVPMHARKVSQRRKSVHVVLTRDLVPQLEGKLSLPQRARKVAESHQHHGQPLMRRRNVEGLELTRRGKHRLELRPGAIEIAHRCKRLAQRGFRPERHRVPCAQNARLRVNHRCKLDTRTLRVAHARPCPQEPAQDASARAQSTSCPCQGAAL